MRVFPKIFSVRPLKPQIFCQLGLWGWQLYWPLPNQPTQTYKLLRYYPPPPMGLNSLSKILLDFGKLIICPDQPNLIWVQKLFLKINSYHPNRLYWPCLQDIKKGKYEKWGDQKFDSFSVISQLVKGAVSAYIYLVKQN